MESLTLLKGIKDLSETKQHGKVIHSDIVKTTTKPLQNLMLTLNFGLK